MYKVKHQQCIRVSSFDKGPVTVTAEEGAVMLKDVEENKIAILEGAFVVEELLGSIINYYFFPENSAPQEKIDLFREHVISTDFFSFNSKIRVLEAILNQTKILEDALKKKYCTKLRDVMHIRNSFAHGEIRTDGKEVRLLFFRGGPQYKTLSDEYLKEIETTLKEAFNETFAIATRFVPQA